MCNTRKRGSEGFQPVIEFHFILIENMGVGGGNTCKKRKRPPEILVSLSLQYFIPTGVYIVPVVQVNSGFFYAASRWACSELCAHRGRRVCVYLCSKHLLPDSIKHFSFSGTAMLFVCVAASVDSRHLTCTSAYSTCCMYGKLKASPQLRPRGVAYTCARAATGAQYLQLLPSEVWPASEMNTRQMWGDFMLRE